MSATLSRSSSDHFSSQTYGNSHPARYRLLTSLFAISEFVNRMFLPSHFSLPGTRTAIVPSNTISVNGPEYAKFEQAGVPPLQAWIQSRWCALLTVPP